LSRLRFLPPLVLLALLVAALGACGGGGKDNACKNESSGPSAGKDPEKIVKEAFAPAKGKTVRCGKFDIDLGVNANGKGGPTDVKIALSGPFEDRGSGRIPRVDLDMKIDAKTSGDDISLNGGFISTGDRGFLKLRGTYYEIEPERFKQIRDQIQAAQPQGGDSAPGAGALKALGLDPRGWLENLHYDGTDDVGGVKANHVSAQVNVDALLDDTAGLLRQAGSLGLPGGPAPGQLSKKDLEAIKGSIEDATFDLYSGADDNIIRKLDLTVNFGDPGAQAGAPPSPFETGDLHFSLVLDEVGTKPDIKAPKGAKPISDLFGDIGLGGSGGTSPGGTTPGGVPGEVPGGEVPTGPSAVPPAPSPGAPPGSSSEDSARAQKYLECIQRAGGSESKARKCADLLLEK
jgi:hypothetical protein